VWSSLTLFDPEKVLMLLLPESNSSNAAIACYRMLIATESHVVSTARNLELHGSSRHPAWHGNGPPTVLVAAQIGALANSKLGCKPTAAGICLCYSWKTKSYIHGSFPHINTASDLTIELNPIRRLWVDIDFFTAVVVHLVHQPAAVTTHRVSRNKYIQIRSRLQI